MIATHLVQVRGSTMLPQKRPVPFGAGAKSLFQFPTGCLSEDGQKDVQKRGPVSGRSFPIVPHCGWLRNPFHANWKPREAMVGLHLEGNHHFGIS